jgi:hypothetical protein
MIELSKARFEDLPAFVALEQTTDTKECIVPYAYEDHARKFADPALVCLRIADGGALGGFLFRLCRTALGRSRGLRCSASA